MTNQEKFIQIFGIVAWQAMIVPSGLAEQFKEYWTSPYNEMNCRDCKEFEDCPCGKDGHENGTSQGYSIGECKDFNPIESEDKVNSKSLCDSCITDGCIFQSGMVRKHCDFYKSGRWIEERTYMECPNCHDIWHYEKNQTERFKFCPTCGKRGKR